MSKETKRFQEAVAFGELEKAKKILKKGGVALDAVDEFGSAPLHSAARPGGREAVAWLLDQGADINVRTALPEEEKESNDTDGATPLMVAAAAWLGYDEEVDSEDGIEVMRLLIERGADLNAQDAEGKTAIFYALSLRGRLPVLLEAGADVNLRTFQNLSPLMLATQQGDQEACALLKAAGAAEGGLLDVGLENVICDQELDSDERLEKVKQFLGRGANANFRAETTVLSGAVIRGHLNVMEALLAAGADPNLADGDDPAASEFPLTHAVHAGNLEAVELLLDHGAAPTTKYQGQDLVRIAKVGQSMHHGSDVPWDKVIQVVKKAIQSGTGVTSSDAPWLELSATLSQGAASLLGELRGHLSADISFCELVAFGTNLLESEDIATNVAQACWAELVGPARAFGWSCFLTRTGLDEPEREALAADFEEMKKKKLDSWLTKERKRRRKEEDADFDETDAGDLDLTFLGHQRLVSELKKKPVLDLQKSKTQFPNFEPSGQAEPRRRVVLLKGTPGAGAIFYRFGMPDDGPTPVQAAQLINRWHRDHGAEVAEFGHNTLELYVEKPLSFEEVKTNLSVFPLFNMDAESFQGNLRMLCSNWWFFWWD